MEKMEAYIALKMIFSAFVISIAGALTYIGLNKEMMMLFTVLLFIDYATGLGKAATLKEDITSYRMKYGIASKFVLILIPVTLAIAAKILGTDFSDILFMGINILVLSEVYSIFGNIYSMKKKKELPEIDAVAELSAFIRDRLILLDRRSSGIPNTENKHEREDDVQR